MNLKAIISALVLASSSAAMAAPSATVSASVHAGYTTTTTTTTVRDHRDDRVVHSPPIVARPTGDTWRGTTSPPIMKPQPVRWDGQSPGRWARPPIFRTVTLASAASFAADGRTFITVGSQLGAFGQLQIAAAGGRTFIQQVYVEFDNGQEQVIRHLDRTLTGNESLRLDLDGDRRGIKRIVVYGKAINGGFYRGNGGFTVVAS